MSKKIKLLIIVLSMFFITACNNPVDKFVKDVKKEVTSSIKSTSKESVKESIKYIHDNYEKKISKKFVYHTLVLRKLCDNSYFADNKIKRLADASYEYMFRQSKGNKKELEDSLDEVYENLDDEVEEFYNLYQRLAIVEGYLAKAKTKLIIESEEKDFITNKKVVKAIDYTRDYYNEAFKNNEIIERLSYYSMYLETVGRKVNNNNSVVKLGNEMKKYLQEGTESRIEKIEKLLEEIENNKDALIGEFIKNN